VAALHLGDYIYEYDSKGYATDDAAALNRVPDPANETLTLADYRRRYAQYRTDADLQALHAAMPMIAVWDDHEVANDTWTGGAENHDPATEGSFSARRAAAIQAWLEWIPIRLPDASKPDQIYRSFDFGTLLSLHMLDTRQVGRDQQLSYANYITASGFDAAGFTSAVGNLARQLMGTAQTAWLQSKHNAWASAICADQPARLHGAERDADGGARRLGVRRHDPQARLRGQHRAQPAHPARRREPQAG
jgi:alkaline phosphatase D